MTVTIRLTKEEEARLEALAKRTGRTKGFYVRTAVREYLEDLEDAYAAHDALQEWKADGHRSRGLAELVSELGLTEADIESGRAENEASGTS
jgi:RHH-type transcriptional regulator, rel operon repressor / antitoxin RelB